jgi:hypothetical protein
MLGGWLVWFVPAIGFNFLTKPKEVQEDSPRIRGCSGFRTGQGSANLLCEPSHHFLNFVIKWKQPVGTGGSNRPGSCALESAEASRLGTNNVS